MGMGVALAAAITFLVLFVALFFHYAAVFRAETREYSGADALKALIADMNQAQRRVLVVCERCKYLVRPLR